MIAITDVINFVLYGGLLPIAFVLWFISLPLEKSHRDLSAFLRCAAEALFVITVASIAVLILAAMFNIGGTTFKF